MTIVDSDTYRRMVEAASGSLGYCESSFEGLTKLGEVSGRLTSASVDGVKVEVRGKITIAMNPEGGFVFLSEDGSRLSIDNAADIIPEQYKAQMHKAMEQSLKVKKQNLLTRK